MGNQPLDNDHIGIVRQFVKGPNNSFQQFVEMRPCR